MADDISVPLLPNYVSVENGEIIDSSIDSEIPSSIYRGLPTETEPHITKSEPQHTTSSTEPYDIGGTIDFTTKLDPLDHTKTAQEIQHSKLSKIYEATIAACAIEPEYLNKTQISLQDIANYLKEDAAEIDANKIASQIYKDKALSEEQHKDITNIVNAYLNFLQDAGLIETKELSYDNTETEPTYRIKPEMHDILESTYKDTYPSKIDELQTDESNKRYADYLEKNMDEFTRETWKAYI